MSNPTSNEQGSTQPSRLRKNLVKYGVGAGVVGVASVMAFAPTSNSRDSDDLIVHVVPGPLKSDIPQTTEVPQTSEVPAAIPATSELPAGTTPTTAEVNIITPASEVWDPNSTSTP